MYSYDEISQKDKDLIIESLIIISNYNIPISRDIKFKYCYGTSRFGWCKKLGDSTYIIAFNKDINSDDKIIETIIHECLHTLDDDVRSHQGIWSYYAKLISDKTKYKITISDDISKINSKKKVIDTTRCICPLCRKETDIPTKNIINGKSTYSCKRCNKYFYIELPESVLKDMDSNNRIKYINSIDLDKLDLDKLLGLLPYTNKTATRIILRHIISNYKYTYDLHKNIYLYAHYDKEFLKELATNYCLGLYDNVIKEYEDRIEFEGLFASTPYWDMVVDYSEEKK